MSNQEKVIQIYKIEIPEKPEVECIYCGATYQKPGHCPKCGGTVTTDMGYPKSLVGQTYDLFSNPNFKPEKVKNEEILARLSRNQ